MFKCLLVANRGEIACRVIRSAQDMGLHVVAVYSEADRDALHVTEADEAIEIGPAAAAASYLNQEAVLAAARACNADAIHPGYGFLAENASFARAVSDAGMTWVGPSPDAIAAMGDKVSARNLMAAAGVPVAQGTSRSLTNVEDAVTAAQQIGYPIMVKAAGGGGGIGMATAEDEAALRASFAATRQAGERFFGSGDVFLERYVQRARHVEVQILGLADGGIVTFPERDCSVQRRNQKVVEETPSPAVSQALRDRMLDTAVQAGAAVHYRGAGTVECLLDVETREFYFLEMNTRLQVGIRSPSSSPASISLRSSCASPLVRTSGSTLGQYVSTGTPSSCASARRTRSTSSRRPAGSARGPLRSAMGSASTRATALVTRSAPTTTRFSRSSAPGVRLGQRRSNERGVRWPASSSKDRRRTCRSSRRCWTTVTSVEETTTRS